MPDTPRLDTPHLRVVMADGTEFEVNTESPDMVYFDLERAKRKWPVIQEAPFLWLSYLAYSKLKRTGEPVPPTFDAWLPKTSRIDNLDADGQPSDEAETAGPTMPGPEPGSLLK